MTITELTIEERIQLLQTYKRAYYLLDEPIISDEEYDEFEQALIDDGYEPSVGYVVIPDGKKIKHTHRMLSLGKFKILEETMSIELAQQLFDKYGPSYMSWKYDGMAGNIQYVDGKLVGIATRGNGVFGQNVTEKLQHLVPSTIKNNLTVEIRCEIVMEQDKWLKNYPNDAHSRNTVAGIVNDQNVNDPRKHDLMIRVIEAIDENGNLLDIEDIDYALALNYKTSFVCNDTDELKYAFDQAFINRSSMNIGTDGMVLTSKSARKHQHNGKHPDYAIALKFKSPSLSSTITKITWKLHKTGRWVPKIHFVPIIVDGREIKQATGHNLEYLVKHDLTIGKVVNIVLANDIIPQIKPI